MSSRMKILGLLCALLALQAIGASAASAVPVNTASAYPATVTSESALGGAALTTEAGSVECERHNEGTLTAASSTVRTTPKYSNCRAFGFLTATVNPEGCTYVSHATEKVGPGVYRHHFDVDCPAGQSIKVIGGSCKSETKGQANKTTVTTTNLENGTMTVVMNVVLELTVTQDGFGCPFSGTGVKTSTYHSDAVAARIGGGTISVSGE
jgi:hypothetical protein